MTMTSIRLKAAGRWTLPARVLSMAAFSSLTNRIFLASALLAVMSIAVAIYVVNAAVTAQAEAELRRGLEEAGTLVEEHRNTLFEHLSREARLIADLPKLKAAVDSDHGPTVQPLAEDYRRELGSDLFVVTNRAGRLLAQVGPIGVGSAPAGLPGIRQAGVGREATWFWPYAGGVLQVVSVPIWIDRALPEILGTLNVGFSLDTRTAARFKALTNSEIAFAVGQEVLASTLPDTDRPALARLIGRSGVSTITLDDSEFVAVTRVLAVSEGALAVPASAPAVGQTPVAIVLRSRSEHLRLLRALHTKLAATALLAVLLATLSSYAVARTVTRPLGAITAAMHEITATGDLTRKIPVPPASVWHDEDTRLLATTFNTMTESIERFQREAAQRERLSSLGRLSTVIAHEIRNPLMIIKTSLRALRCASPDPDQVQAAAADIEEEVGRLNRLVGEVLDFARPIKFEYAAVDLNALCQSAVRAAAAGDAAVDIRLDLDQRVGSVVVDGERLRLALINILANARHAIAMRAKDPAASAVAVTVTTRLEGDDSVMITVHDEGVGIAAADLPRIFEPYFTTKRTGSGLGLAIAKNIVEGLGGTLVIASEVGRGTQTRIRIPLAAPIPASEPAVV